MTTNSPVVRPIRVLELRSVRGKGGGPEKTILLGAAQSDPQKFAITVCYLRDKQDLEFNIKERADPLGIDYVEIQEEHSWDFKIFTKLRSLVREKSIDIVHAHDYKTDFLALALSRVEKVIPLATSHGWITNTWKERLYQFCDIRLLKHFPRVITVSEPIRQQLIRAGARPSRVVKIRNGIDAEYFRRQDGVKERMRSELSIPQNALVLGAVGRLSPEKRFDLLLQTAASLTEYQPWVVIAGDGPSHQELVKLAVQLGIDARVKLLGHRSDVREIHQTFDIYVQTSDTEGIPNAILEAMALEVPVVATDVGGTRELIENLVTGVLVPPQRSEKLKQAIQFLHNNNNTGDLMVQASRKKAEVELSFLNRNRLLENVLEQLSLPITRSYLLIRSNDTSKKSILGRSLMS